MIYRSLVTVLEPATSYDLISIDQVKAFYNISTTVDDVRLQTLITLQSKIISDYCQRVFAKEKVEETIYVNETAPASDVIALPLDRWPVTKVYGITRDSASLTEGTDFRIDNKSGTLHGSLVGDEVTVTYDAGYELPVMAPGPLSMAVIVEVRQSFFYGSRDPMIRMINDNAAGSISFFPPPGISSGGRSGGGGGGGSSAKPLSAQAAALVSPFRRPGVA